MTLNLSDQINLDQKRYSRYVCDSRAIPNAIDGLKPVQRRILWTMWNNASRDRYTKTVKVSGLVMGYHPHGDTSIQEALSQMAQEFTFANNYSLISGEGTFGDVLDPKAIASPRYTEVKISDFAKDLGLFESLPDLAYTSNYDETDKEPVFFVPKVPLVLLNPIIGIATGFSCNMQAHRLSHVANAVIAHLRGKPFKTLKPWYRGYHGKTSYEKNDNGNHVYRTHFEITEEEGTYFIKNAPQSWNREKTILYLEDLISENSLGLKGYVDHSRSSYRIELVFKRGAKPHHKNLLNALFSKTNQEVIVPNVIRADGRLAEMNDRAIIEEFMKCRRNHLIKRFERLAALEEAIIKKNKELIRFIKEKWPQRVPKFSNKETLKNALEGDSFHHSEWLSSLPIYRMTMEEVKKSQHAIQVASSAYKNYMDLFQKKSLLDQFMHDEITRFTKKWDRL